MFRTTTSTAEMATFLCRADNIGVLVHDPVTGATAAVDAPDAAAIRDALAQTGWTLSHILLTHHHGDHTEGVAALATDGVTVVGAEADRDRLPPLAQGVREGDSVQCGALRFSVLETPGHTRGHVSYLLAGDPPALFCADTLFSMGCGRLFEGSPAAMWASLLKLRALPGATLVWCGHEYTAANLRFALSLAPNDFAIAAAGDRIRALLGSGALTVPTSICAETKANPFMRADDPAFVAAIGLSGASPADVFAHVRKAKDAF